MKKYKVCPACGAHNDPLLLECSECEADLQSVPVTDKENEQAASQPEVPRSPMVRVCDCGAKNPVQSRRCTACGEDISTIAPTPDTSESSELHYILSSLDGAFAYEIKDGVTLIGREGEMREYLSSKPYVSRKHAELTLDGGILRIKNCSTTNFTFVNNKMLSGDMETELKDGDELGLGGNEQKGSRQEEAAYFLVRIGSCT